MSHESLTFSGGGGSWRIEGELNHVNADALLTWSSHITVTETVQTLDLAGLEIGDAAGIAAAIESLRQISQHTPIITIDRAPQLLAHTLYRIGLLGAGSHLVLVEPRQEEPYG